MITICQGWTPAEPWEAKVAEQVALYKSQAKLATCRGLARHVFLVTAPERGNAEGFPLVRVKISRDNGMCKYQLTSASEEPSGAKVLLYGRKQHSSAITSVPSPSWLWKKYF